MLACGPAEEKEEKEEQEEENSNESLNCMADSLCKAFHKAAEETLPVLPAKPAKPWIQARALEIIDQRNKARRERDNDLEKELNKQIRKSAKEIGQSG